MNAFLQTFHAFFIGLIFCIFRAAEVRERIKRIKTASLASGIATEPLSSSQWEPHLGLKHEIFKPPHKMKREKESSCLFQELVENVIRGSFVDTEFTFVTVAVFPATKVCRSWQCVDASVDHEL